jgi:outer membrane protein assembly factor BamB
MTERELMIVLSGDVLSAFHRVTGKTVWSVVVPNWSVRVRLAVGAGLVFVHSDKSSLYAVDYATGKLRWEQKTHAKNCDALLIDGDVVVSRCGTAIECFGLDGAPRWATEVKDSYVAFGFPGNVMQLDREH